MGKITIELPDGTSAEVDVALLKGYMQESFEHLRAEAKAKALFKAAIETQAETLELPKALLSKYIKAAYKTQTKETSALGELFAALDEATADDKNAA